MMHTCVNMRLKNGSTLRNTDQEMNKTQHGDAINGAVFSTKDNTLEPSAEPQSTYEPLGGGQRLGTFIDIDVHWLNLLYMDQVLTE